MKQGSRLLGIATALALSGAIGPALALNPGDTVDNFRLLDHTGASRQLYYLSDMKAVVLMAQGGESLGLSAGDGRDSVSDAECGQPARS